MRPLDVIYPWVRIPDERWHELEALAEKRDALSARAANTRRWRPDFNLVGLCGEQVYSYMTSLPVNEAVEIRDGGRDFPGIDVKTTTGERIPTLRVPHGDVRAPMFFLAELDLERHMVHGVGYATRRMVLEAPLKHARHSKSHTLAAHELLTADYFLPRLLDRLGMT